MLKEPTKEKQVLDLARKAKILRVQELVEKGIHPEHLRRLYQRGLLVRIGRGVYMLPEASISGNFSLAESLRRYREELSVYSRHCVSTSRYAKPFRSLDST